MNFGHHLEKIATQMAKQNEEARAIMLDMLDRDYSQDQWRGLIAVPEGSILESILGVFRRETDIPLELPLFATLHFLSGILLSKRVQGKGALGKFYPELWTVVLADSGAGKTLAHDLIASESPVKSTFPKPASGARFIESFVDHNYELWYQDEFSTLMKKIENGQIPDVRDYLLEIYGNKPIERSTKQETITINEPVIGILGLNTPEAFYKSIKPESLLDGFAQRFGYIIAHPDPERNVNDDPYKYAHYNTEAIRVVIRRAFARLAEIKIHPVYTVSPQADEAYKVAFEALQTPTAPMSFFRRILFKSYRYSLLYHILLGKESSIIDAEDMGWGINVCRLHLQDLKHLVKRDEIDELGQQIVKAKKLKMKFAESNKSFTASSLQQNMRVNGEKMDAKTAKALFALI